MVNPYTAFVWMPFSLVNNGKAKNARYAKLFPSNKSIFFAKKLPLSIKKAVIPSILPRGQIEEK